MRYLVVYVIRNTLSGTLKQAVSQEAFLTPEAAAIEIHRARNVFIRYSQYEVVHTIVVQLNDDLSVTIHSEG